MFKADASISNPLASQGLGGAETLRDQLRGDTHLEHQRLHEVPAFLALRRGDLSLADFIRLLKSLTGIHEPFEAALAAHDDLHQFSWRAIAACPNRPRRLMSDLSALGVPEAEVALIPRADLRKVALSDPDAALGAAWVIEGSSIGGGVIAKWLVRSLGIGPANGGAFFGHTVNQTDRWRGCCAAIESRGATETGRRRIVDGAQATFSQFSTWFAMGA